MLSEVDCMENLGQIPDIQILTETITRDFPLECFILFGVLVFLIFVVVIFTTYLKKIVKWGLIFLVALSLFTGEWYLYKNVLNSVTHTCEILIEDHIDLEELSRHCDKITIQGKKAIVSWSEKIE